MIEAWVHLVLVAALTQGQCVTKKEVDPGSGSKVPCVFPFQYRGAIYNTCSDQDSQGGKLWCSTRVDQDGKHIEGEGNWGYCTKGCPAPPGCPQGWARLSTGCYLFGNDEEGLDISGAEEMCSEFGGYLAEIETKEEQEALMEYYEKESASSECLLTHWQANIFFLGATKVGGDWVWRKSGQSLNRTFTNWYDGVFKENEPNKNCAGMIADSGFTKKFGVKNYGWGPGQCEKKKHKIEGFTVRMQSLCEKDVDPAEKVVDVPDDVAPKKKTEYEANGCLSGWTKIGTSCYLFKMKASTRKDADKICQEEGGYVVEIDSEEEQDALTSYYQKYMQNLTNSCSKNNFNIWWIGAKDRQPAEGSWAWGYTKKPLEFTAWQSGEPNNHGGKEPGENCATAGLNHIFKSEARDLFWHDVNCFINGFETGWTETWSGVTINPLCEQFSVETPAPQSSLQCPENSPLSNDCMCGEDPCSEGQACSQGICMTSQCGSDVTAGKCQCGANTCLNGQICQNGKCTGCGTGWTQLGAGCYKFHEVEGGTTKMEADKICQENGGYLVEIGTVEEKQMLEKHHNDLYNKVEESWLYSLLSFNKAKSAVAGGKSKKSPGWWIGATDEQVEGKWVWGNSGKPVTLNFWYNWGEKYEPNNDNWGFGGEDCAAIIRGSDLDPSRIKEKENFGWIDITCFRGIVPHFEIQLNPLCKKSV